ncbi:hypothetical protein N7457_005552 [Penicillium paradoxum]|uniref:uncharacterized protein n=1 Tax=Penicillium paradoxum TaxID=176176 RepID=UPI002549A578|nr:uncharacterized protein N7457_005552 [Penicillium paradoxum]KAJ5780392.1 hypothetical protein N7457_005552 [Penicillium paradoxum]
MATPNDPVNGGGATDWPSKPPTLFSCMANVECIYRAPPPRRRKRDRETNGSLFQERRKALKRRPDIGSTTHHHPAGEDHRTDAGKGGSGRMIIKDGNSIYIDNNLWASVSNELSNAADVLGDVSDTGTDDFAQDVNDDYTILSTSATKHVLTGLHPNPLNIFKLWQAFLENVNPLTKIIHAPTVQQQILEATSDLPKEEDVKKLFGESKKALLSKSRRGAQLAFRNATLLRTSSSVVLQAFMLYLLCMRAFSDPHTIWTLCGIATRIAQRIGIHRDGSGHGLSIFETEMRRRIWFQLVIIDATSAQFCGVASTPLPATIDVQPPMNANDSDLDPRMTEPACEKPGSTEMIFVLARSGFGKWLHRLSKKVEGSKVKLWDFLSSSSMSLVDKDKAIDELETYLEENFIRHCDKSIPLHMATETMARSAIYYTRFMAHHPRQYQDPNTRISQAEKDVIFEYSLKMIEYADYAQSNSVVQKFSWHMVNHMPWDAIIFMLSEMQHRADPEEKSKVWQLIGRVYLVYSGHIRDMGKKDPTPLHMAIQNLILKAWWAYIEECNLNHRIPTPCPTIVTSLIATMPDNSRPQSERNDQVIALCEGSKDHLSHGISISQFAPEADNLEFSHGDSPKDWNDWDNLLAHFQDSLANDTMHLS